MARDTRAAALALHRFGLGPRAGAIEAIQSDPQGAMIAELDRPGSALVAAAALPSSGAANRAVFEYNAERNAKDKLARRGREAAQKVAENATRENAGTDNAMATPPAMAAQPEPVPLPRRIFLDEAKARFDGAIGEEIGFVERLVWFWSNHFCVNADSTVMAGGYEREAIRPYALGRFADMLQAAEAPPGDAALFEQRAVGRPELDRRHQPRPGAQREFGARDPRIAYARGTHRLLAGRRHQLR
jgi:uncharacterized protein (DUF1800 family)